MGCRFLSQRFLGIVAAFLFAIGASWARSPEYRVMWVSRFEWPNADEATAKANIDNIMQQLADNGFNAVLFQVRGQCDVHYPSPYEPWASTYGWTNPGWDPLAYAIQAAHARGLEFHAYINTHTLAQQIPPANTTPQHPYNLHGPNVPLEQSWLIRDTSGATLVTDNYYWISPGIPEASWWVRRAIMHVVENYDVDGVHFDRIRTPGPGFSYDPITVARFNGEGNPDGLGWADFMRSQITRDLRNIYGEIQWKKKKVKVSAAPFGIVYKDATTSYQGTGTQSYHQWYQDSWGWLAAHVMDFIVPQIYWEVGSSHPFEALLNDWQQHRAGRFIVAGSTTNGGTKAASSLLAEYQQTVLQNAAGHCIFSVSSMGPYWSTFATGPYAQPAAIPDMPWKSAPTTGNIVGYVRDKFGYPVLDARVKRSGDSYTYLSAFDGFFAILEVPTSVPITLTATKAGKGNAVLSGIQVQAGETTVVTLTLSFRTASLTFDKPQYTFQEPVRVTLVDDDLSGAGSVPIVVRSTSEPTGETVMLEEATTAGIFQGSVLLRSVGAPVPNGVLRVAAGDTISTEYFDPDDGSGNPTTATATATVVAPQDIILESRRADGTLTPSPAYQEVPTSTSAWANTTAKSLAPGLVAPGSRFVGTGSLGAYAVWRPNIPVDGYYNVYITLANASRGPNNYSPGASFEMTQEGDAPVTGTFDLSKTNTELTDKWYLLASEVSLGRGNLNSLTVRNNNPNSASNQRFCMDAVKFVFVREREANLGTVRFDAPVYRGDARPRITLVDDGLAGQGNVAVSVASTTEQTSETILLPETALAGVFESSVQLAVGDPNPGDGVLQVHDGDQITVAYLDTDNGSGSSQLITATAMVDARPPHISEVTVEMLDPVTARVTFLADELSSAVVEYGTACGEFSGSVSSGTSAYSHNVLLSPLLPTTTYYFRIIASDEVQNVSVSDNGGTCYSFHTPELPFGLDEHFDSDPVAWNATGLWHLVGVGNPCATPATPPRAYYYGRDDTCTYNTGSVNMGTLSSPPFVVPPLGELSFSSIEMTEGNSTWDTRKVYLNSISTGERVLVHQSSAQAPSWTTIGPLSLADYAGQVVFLEFEFNTVDSLFNDYLGWAIDDVVVTSADKLRVEPSEDFFSWGNEGGPFHPPAKTYWLANEGDVAVSWTTTATANWLAFLPAEGVLDPGATTTVTVLLALPATALPTGLYEATFAFTNVASNWPRERHAVLLIANPPAAPSELTVTDRTRTSISLAWLDQADDETTYIVERDTGEGFVLLAELPPNATTFTDTGLAPATCVRYRVAAQNPYGSSPYSNEVDACTLPAIPQAPTGLAAVSVTQTQVVLTWEDNSDNETGFRIQRDGGSGFSTIGEVSADTTSFTDDGLEPDSLVRYRVCAFNESGESPYSEELEVRTLPNPPVTPTNLSAQAQPDGTVHLTWTDQATNESNFELEYQIGENSFMPLATLAANSTSWHHVGAPGSARLCYRIRAINAGGASDWSEVSCVVTPQRSDFETGPEGWSLVGVPDANVWGDHDPATEALRLTARAATSPRILGWQSPRLPISEDPATIYRFKAFVYRTGQSDLSDQRQVPNLRLRCAVRYSINSMLELFFHNAADPASDPDMLANLPSTDPANPTIYRVDLDLVDIPYLHPSLHPEEGVQAMFEMYALEPQENGSIALTEAVLLAMPAPSEAELRPLKTYKTTSRDAGDFKNPTILRSTLYGSNPLPLVYARTPLGLVLDTTRCSHQDIGIAVAEISAGNDLTKRVRVEPGKTYRLRWHVTSPRATNLQAQLRLRARTLRFAWSQKFELGGAWPTPTLPAQTIAQQALPGVGTLNPDKRGDEIPSLRDGGWYTMYFHAPNVVPATQPPPGSASSSRRDLKCGIDVIDTISCGPGAALEGGLYILDAIEIADFDMLPD
jgi:uncharacterized lipoprotein YddW (UPF0748 family)